MPCIADPQKLRVIAKVEGEVYEAFPYLDTITLIEDEKRQIDYSRG